MRWLLKASVQRGLGFLPQGERLNYVLQRRALRSLPLGDEAFLGKVERAVQHVTAFRDHGRAISLEALPMASEAIAGSAPAATARSRRSLIDASGLRTS